MLLQLIQLLQFYSSLLVYQLCFLMNLCFQICKLLSIIIQQFQIFNSQEKQIMPTCQQLIKQNLFNVIQYSSFHLMGLGQYNDCLEISPNYKYNLLKLSVAQTTGPVKNIYGIMGLCLPSKCLKNDIKSTVNQILKNMSVNANVQTIHNNYPQNVKTSLHWTIYVFFTLLLISMSLCIYATIMIHLKKKTKLKMFGLQESKIFFKRSPQNNLNVLNGVKSLAMLGIVFRHTGTNFDNSINYIDAQNHSLNTYYLFVIGGRMAVGVFFLIGGFLASFVVLKQVWKSNWRAITNVFHRVLRMYPTFLFISLFYYSCTVHLVNGPNTSSFKGSLKVCEKLYNLMTFRCLGVSWYLHVDVQFYAVSMVLFLIYKYNRIASKIVLWIIILLSLIKTTLYCQKQNPKILFDYYSTKYQTRWDADQYFRPWLWIPIYFLGVFVGMLYNQYLQEKKQAKKVVNYFQNKKQTQNVFSLIELTFKKNKYWRFFIESIGILMMSVIIFLPKTLQLGMEWSQFYHSLYLIFSYFIFVIGLIFTILPSMLGVKNSIINMLLDTEIFNFLAKVSYATYLIHKTLVNTWYVQQPHNIYYKQTPRFIEFVSLSVCSILLGFVITILVEAPFNTINKNLTNYLKQISQKKVQKQRNKNNIQQDMQETQLILKIDQPSQQACIKQILEEKEK